MKTWQQLRECDIRNELLDDQYGLVGNRDTSGTDYPDAIVISLGFAKSLSERFPDLAKMLEEEIGELQTFEPLKKTKGQHYYLNGQGSRMR